MQLGMFSSDLRAMHNGCQFVLEVSHQHIIENRTLTNKIRGRGGAAFFWSSGNAE